MRRALPAAVLAAMLAAVTVLLSACAVGPDFVPPPPPAVRTYDTGAPPGDGTGKAAAVSGGARTAVGADVPAQWWQLFRAPALDQTLRLALADNPTLEAANATLAAAREAIIVARAGFLPQLGASAGVQRSGTSLGGSAGAAVPARDSSLYSVGLTAGYSFDAFGGATRRLVEQQRSLAEEQRYQLAAAYLSLTGNVVSEVLTIASTRAQLSATQDLLADDQKNLDLTQREFEVGAAARTDVLTAQSQLASDQTELPSLQQQLAQARHALAILVGKAPAEWSAPDYELQRFTLPSSLPLSLPSALVRQRPDILASEAQLHADSAAVGIAVAQEYPSITLSADLTREGLGAADLFQGMDALWDVGGALTQPLFRGGALRAQTRAARDTLRAQAADYREVVLTAFGQVADDLRALEHDADRVGAYQRSLAAARESLVLQRASYAAGKTSVLQLIDAERSYSQALLGSVGASSQQLQDAVQLFVALGGGWWNSPIAH
ncbi:MAG TPA: efflux transporter outer membrane subunit [Steroidobacteraceae bacterium]|nr:efflux transporter outer membrane subunit [Steroidobacteraceae bacterium]